MNQQQINAAIDKGTYGANAQILQATFYSTVTLDATTTVYPFFNKTSTNVADTNMKNAGQIPKGQGFNVHEVALTINPTAPIATIAALQDFYNYVFNAALVIGTEGQAPLLEIPLADVFGVGFMATLVETITGNKAPVMPSFNSKYNLAIPIKFSQQVTLESEIKSAAPAAASVADWLVRLSLNGVKVRRS